ncbi:cyclic AMP-dependent transcription factor ATF-4 [Brachionichthys hirsutus]|uniref:cyclic AMP-dependent transcription factor ATF-4 n=1 Tax=Brachionichthys hirsutus TaxID=412623 RepID=UPI00360431E3
MADPLGPLLDQDEGAALSPSSSFEGWAPSSPSPSLSSYAPSLAPYQTVPSPPASPPPIPSFLGTKAGTSSPSLPWLAAGDLLGSQDGADRCRGDAFEDMGWMSEKMALSGSGLDSFIDFYSSSESPGGSGLDSFIDFYSSSESPGGSGLDSFIDSCSSPESPGGSGLDFLIDSCSSSESPGSPEELLPSLDSHMDLGFESYGVSLPELGLLPSGVPVEPPAPAATASAEEEVVLKAEPPSPAPAPPSPVDTLDLGSEVDVLDAGKMSSIPDPGGSVPSSSPFVLPPPASGRIVLVLANKSEPSLVPLSDLSSDCDSDSGIESVSSSSARPPSPPPAGSSRTKPYSKAESGAAPPSAKTPRVKSVSGVPKVVEKKLKKMEQNKTAATRYRQKKRVEQEQQGSELDDLQKRNHELAEKAESIGREIQYLKDLMEEVRKRRLGRSGPVTDVTKR